MTRVAVVGATGYAGAELVRILAGHPETKLAVLTSRQFAGVRFDQVYPAMAGRVDAVCQEYAVDHVCENADMVFMALPHQLPMTLVPEILKHGKKVQFAGVRFDQVYPAMAGRVDAVCQEYAVDHVCENADMVFMALPHQLPMTLVPEILKHGKKVIDLSADFRFNDANFYESTYQPHAAVDLLDSAVYGLSEIYTDQIASAALIGNPGCYPTSVLLALVPLLKQGLLDPGMLIADSKSGVSGAGRSLALASHFCEVNESFKAYKVAAHRHNPEMNAVLSREAGKPISITFVPHLVPMTRGMLTTIYATPIAELTHQDVVDCYLQAYGQRPFIRLCPEGRLPDTLHVRGTNFCDIGFTLDKGSGRLILISAIDNLVKGAAGQAVQNMNLMQGFDETAGLLNVPFPL
jgi:N-acetyl-gamma-glutamyl-phosphate reductase